MYHKLCAGLSEKQLTLPELCKVGTEQDLCHELSLSGKSLDGYPENLLSNFEKSNKEKYERLLGDDGCKDLEAFCLGQNPEHRDKSTTNGVLPLFTKTDRHIWIPSKRRHLLAIEKYAGHGFGISGELSALLKTPAS